jgi:3-carboxy-cis,cis-muconate cycloisomerase
VTDFFWPGDHRAGELFSEETFLEALTAVEVAWLDTLVEAGVAPPEANADLEGLVEPFHEEWLVEETEAGGNPVMGLVGLLRSCLEDEHPAAARWLHRGLTSQDVLDTALMLLAQDAVEELRTLIRGQAERLNALARTHRGTPMVARTLTQHAVPTTFGMKAGQWLTAVLDAYDDLVALTFPVQVGGAAGTRAALRELGADPALAVPALASRLGLRDALPWHTVRTPVTRLGDALVRCTDAWGRIAEDVLVLSRPEIGELSEGTGGGSSTMPHKQNPVLSALIRRAALTTPQLAATLHLAAAQQVDERAAGAWHAEWATLRDLVRRTVVAGSHAFDLVAELQVHPDRMAATLDAAREDALAEQRSMADLTGRAPSGPYLGDVGTLVDDVLVRARTTLGEPS